MVTPEYARAYIDEITRLAHPTTRTTRAHRTHRPHRASLGGLLRRLSR